MEEGRGEGHWKREREEGEKRGRVKEEGGREDWRKER